MYIFVMDFEWDEQKNRINYAKHKVSFELACKVFDDPLVNALIKSWTGRSAGWLWAE